MKAEESLKAALLHLLRNDPEVQAAVLDCRAQEELPLLAPLTEAETALIEPVSADEPYLHEDTEALRETIARQERQLESMRQQQTAMQDVLASYARLESVYGDYLELPHAIREAIGKLLNDSSPLAFAVTGARLEVLIGLYERICEIWEDCTAAELNALNGCFDLLFDLYLLGDTDLHRIVTQSGTHYDEEHHILTPDSTPGQRILQVIISGFAGEGILARSLVKTGSLAFPEQI